MRLAITGAAGMLGQDLVAVATSAGHDVAAWSRAELDISDRGAVDDALRGAGADVVVNCAELSMRSSATLEHFDLTKKE